MTQLALTFPPPMTPKQLAAAEELARLCAAARSSERVRNFPKRREAARKGWQMRRAEG